MTDSAAVGEGGLSITAVLATLETQDPTAAHALRAAFGPFTARQRPTTITEEWVAQTLVGEPPPVASLTGLTRGEVVAALARAFDVLGLPRHAALCREEGTLGTSSGDSEGLPDGLVGDERTESAWEVSLPDLPELGWGVDMGAVEARAVLSTATFLEHAVAAGDLVPGRRGWKRSQEELVRAHLTMPRPELDGRTLLSAVHGERVERWLQDPPSPTRRALLEGMADRLLRPVALPSNSGPLLPPLHWLLDHLAGGVALTQTGNLNQAFVRDAASRFGWWDAQVHGLPRTENDVGPLAHVDQLARRLGLARRSGRMLALTARGRRLRSDPEELWRTVARSVLPSEPFGAMAGELLLALLVETAAVPHSEVLAVVEQVAAEGGWRDGGTGRPPDRNVVIWAVYATFTPCRALGLLAAGDDWRDRQWGLTEIGTATAIEALRARAVRPRSHRFS
jgi:hypothetical protein